MRIQGDAASAEELKQSLESAWKDIVKTQLPELDSAKTKMSMGNLGYGKKVDVKKQEIAEILSQMRAGVKDLPNYINLLRRQ